MTQQWLKQASGGYCLLKEHQTCLGFSPTIEVGNYNQLEVARWKNKTWPLVPVYCWDNNLKRRTAAMALPWVKHKNLFCFASRDKLGAGWSDLPCHKSKERSHRIMFALKHCLFWSGITYLTGFALLHICTDKDRAACAEYPWRSMSQFTAIAKSFIILYYKSYLCEKWNSSGTNFDSLQVV